MKDPIIEEIRKVRDDIANEVDYDVRALGRRLQKAQKDRKGKVVSLSPNSVKEDYSVKKIAKK